MKTRFFLASYHIKTELNNGVGNIFFSFTDGFPSNQWLKGKAAALGESFTAKDIVILMIQELTKEDFIDFVKDEESNDPIRT